MAATGRIEAVRKDMRYPGTIRAKLLPYGLFPLGGLAVLSAIIIRTALAPSYSQWSQLIAVVLPLAAAMGLLEYWIFSRTVVVLDVGYLSAHAFCMGTRTLHYDCIQSVQVGAIVYPTGSVHCLRICDLDGQIISLVIRSFRRADLALILDEIMDRAPHAQLDACAEQLRSGQFDPQISHEQM